MPRNKTFDEETVMDAVQNLFWKKGFADTSISDIEQATGLIRTSIYATFGDKENLYQRALLKYHNEGQNNLDAVLNETNNPLENLKKLFKISIISGLQDEEKKGCFIMNATAERYNLCPKTTKFIRQNRKIIIHKFTKVFDKAKSQDLIHRNADSKIYANLAFSIYSGLMLSCKSGAKKDELMNSLELFFRNFF